MPSPPRPITADLGTWPISQSGFWVYLSHYPDPELMRAALRAERRRLEKTQPALAKMLHVEPNTLARWESGRLAVPFWVVDLLHLQWVAAKQRGRLFRLEGQGRRAREPRKTVRRDPGLAAVQVYHRLAAKYHPDRRPEYAEFMKDLNELYQAATRNL